MKTLGVTSHHFEAMKNDLNKNSHTEDPQSNDEIRAMLERSTEEAEEGGSVMSSSKTSATANATANNTAFVCHDLCVVCSDGQRAVFIKRGQSFLKKLINVALIPTAIAASAVAPWATLIAGGVYYLADKNFADKLGAECPSIQVLQFDGAPGAGDSAIHQPDMSGITRDPSNPVNLLTKNLDKMFENEEKEKKKAAGVKTGWFSSIKSFFVKSRNQGQMTDLIMRVFDDSEVFCGEHEKVKRGSTGPVIKEQGSLAGIWSAATGGIQKMMGANAEDIGFASTCREFYKINSV